MCRTVVKTLKTKVSNTVNEAFKCFMTLPDMDTAATRILITSSPVGGELAVRLYTDAHDAAQVCVCVC